MIRSWVLALVGACLLLAGPAHAVTKEAKEKAKTLYKSGMQHYNLSEHEKALEDFKAAYREIEDPTFLFNIAQCQRALGKKEEAVLSYRAFVREAKGIPQETRNRVEEIVVALESSIRDERDAKARLEAARVQEEARVAAQAKADADARAAAAVAAAPVVEKKKPVYKKWWFWTAIGGGAAAVALGVGLGLGLSSHATTYPSPPTAPAGGTLQF